MLQAGYVAIETLVGLVRIGETGFGGASRRHVTGPYEQPDHDSKAAPAMNPMMSPVIMIGFSSEPTTSQYEPQ